ncbi:MAG: hypothetical protein LC747_06800, partial [Acidobacteria bacterium]|nr:hypothetical protein [Acidobacteriota bacterium]
MRHAPESTRPSPSILNRRPRFNSPHQTARLRWIALCIIAALVLSSCERVSVNEQDKLARKNEQTSNTDVTRAEEPMIAANTAVPMPQSAMATTTDSRARRERADGDFEEQRFNTEAYKHIDENPFFEVARAPLST